MGTIHIDKVELLFDMSKGVFQIESINIAWDFREGLTKEHLNQDKQSMWCLKNGRILMPQCGIY